MCVSVCDCVLLVDNDRSLLILDGGPHMFVKLLNIIRAHDRLLKDGVEF